MDALELLENLQSLNLKGLAVEALEQNEELMADLNASQMARGKRASGTDIKPAYSPLTKELKRAKSGLASVIDRVTLYDKGDFYRGLYAEVKGDEIEYGSTDYKEEALQNKYGKTILGLSDESATELEDSKLRGDFIEKIQDYTGLE